MKGTNRLGAKEIRLETITSSSTTDIQQFVCNKRETLIFRNCKCHLQFSLKTNRLAALPVAREFEVNDFFINLEVAFSQETDLLRCNDMCGKDGYLGSLTL